MKNSYKSVLFVEYNETDQLIARKIMQITGFAKDVTIKDSEQGALDFLSAARNDSTQLPEVIFLDVRLRKSNSLSFLSAFEELPVDVKQKCKIVILSNSDNRDDIPRITDHSFVKEVLHKPLTVDTILGLSI